jgi:hypothetical protein
MVLWNLTLARLQRRVLLSIMKAFSWATKFASKFLAVEGVLQNSVETRALVSSAVRWVTGLGNVRIMSYNATALQAMVL